MAPVEKPNHPCSVCKLGGSKANGKALECNYCTKFFHQKCGQLVVIQYSDGPGKVCKSCLKILPKDTPASDDDDSLLMAASNASTSNLADAKLDKIIDKLEGFGNRLVDIESTLKDLPILATQVQSHGEQISDIRRDLDQIKQRMDSQVASGFGAEAGADVTLVKKVIQLEKRNAMVSSRVNSLNTMRSSLYTDLVIGGLNVPSKTNLKTLVLAVLCTLLPDVSPSDIKAVRQLGGNRAHRGQSETPASNLLATATGAIRKTVANATHSLSSATSSSAGSASALPSTGVKPPPILVTLSSRSLLEAIIDAKISFGKLHTSCLTAKLPADFLPESIAPGLLNVNEFLPKEIHAFNHRVRMKAKEPGSGFISFVRRGEIYVRRNRSDVPTMIVNDEDLDHFLAS